MANYDRHYDYGLRGFDERLRRGGGAAPRSGPPERRAAPRTPRVTAAYNRDYVYGGRGADSRPINYNPYGGDDPYRIGGPDEYRRPYNTIGGTRTYRGTIQPPGYDREVAPYDAPFRRR